MRSARDFFFGLSLSDVSVAPEATLASGAGRLAPLRILADLLEACIDDLCPIGHEAAVAIRELAEDPDGVAEILLGLEVHVELATLLRILDVSLELVALALELGQLGLELFELGAVVVVVDDDHLLEFAVIPG
jgi:hypothetical protein